MEIKNISELLASNGLANPNLNVLIPDANNYSVLLMQPHGDIKASESGVFNQDASFANLQFGEFLRKAKLLEADLVATPEYSMPWATLIQEIASGTTPVDGKIWALGCESILVSQLDDVTKILGDHTKIIYEQLPSNSNKFVDPLAYIFQTNSLEDPDYRVLTITVQFKTHAMSEPDHFEVNGMERGKNIYKFSNSGQSNHLVSLICSDVLAFQDNHALEIHEKALILNLQLNRDPRHSLFLQCRERLLRYSNVNTEIICLNWASDVRMIIEGHEDQWNNIAGSAWYIQSETFDDRDRTLCKNHKKGLYYTWNSYFHSHVLFLNYLKAIFFLTSTKVEHSGVVAPFPRRRGPQLNKTFTWSQLTEQWEEQDSLEDGFSSIAPQSGNASHDIESLSNDNPLNVERLVALTTGDIDQLKWHNVKKLKSCTIEHNEVIKRITYAQDTNHAARSYRNKKLKRSGRLYTLLLNEENLPVQLKDLKNGFSLNWERLHPHQNINSTTDERATAIYMGEETNADEVEAVYKRVLENLKRSIVDEDDLIAASQRVAVWYRNEDDEVICFFSNRIKRYDKVEGKSEFDIGRNE